MVQDPRRDKLLTHAHQNDAISISLVASHGGVGRGQKLPSKFDEEADEAHAAIPHRIDQWPGFTESRPFSPEGGGTRYRENPIFPLSVRFRIRLAADADPFPSKAGATQGWPTDLDAVLSGSSMCLRLSVRRRKWVYPWK
jgi:hypothetical protein